MDSSLFLIKEFEALQNESKRKYPSITKDIKETINILKEKGQKKSSTHEQEDICDFILAPIRNVFELKAQKLYPATLNTLGKMWMTPYLTWKGSVMTVKILSGILSQELKDEMMQINVLQIIMVWLSPNKFMMSPEFVENTMSILLKLYESKSKAVVSTAKAALNQMFSHVITNLIKSDPTEAAKAKEDEVDSDEEVKGEMTTKVSKLKSTSNSSLTLLISSQLLSGLVSHLNPDKETKWQVSKSNQTIALALDLLALVISEGKQELAKFPQLMIILDEVFDPLLNQMTSMKSDYGISIRLIHWITLFSIYIEWGLEPLTRWWLTFINIKATTWQKLIAFESFSLVFNSKSLIKILSESNEQWWLANILKVFEEYTASIGDPLGDDIFGHRHPFYQSQKLSKYLEDKNFDNQIPPPEIPVLIKLLIECLHNKLKEDNETHMNS